MDEWDNNIAWGKKNLNLSFQIFFLTIYIYLYDINLLLEACNIYKYCLYIYNLVSLVVVVQRNSLKL